jgi:hypothetical protein
MGHPCYDLARQGHEQEDIRQSGLSEVMTQDMKYSTEYSGDFKRTGSFY